MFKREYLVSYNWTSQKHGNGTGYIVFPWFGKIKSDDLGVIISKINYYLKNDNKLKDNNDCFSIVILNIVRL